MPQGPHTHVLGVDAASTPNQGGFSQRNQLHVCRVVASLQGGLTSLSMVNQPSHTHHNNKSCVAWCPARCLHSQSTTSFLTAAMLVYATGAGVTAAAGTRLALQSILTAEFG